MFVFRLDSCDMTRSIRLKCGADKGIYRTRVAVRDRRALGRHCHRRLGIGETDLPVEKGQHARHGDRSNGLRALQ
jgi:hypothetical protein